MSDQGETFNVEAAASIYYAPNQQVVGIEPATEELPPDDWAPKEPEPEPAPEPAPAG